jgi:hypothetical protein
LKEAGGARGWRRGWRLEAGGWRLEAGGWRLEAGGWRRLVHRSLLSILGEWYMDVRHGAGEIKFATSDIFSGHFVQQFVTRLLSNKSHRTF